MFKVKHKRKAPGYLKRDQNVNLDQQRRFLKSIVTKRRTRFRSHAKICPICENRSVAIYKDKFYYTLDDGIVRKQDVIVVSCLRCKGGRVFLTNYVRDNRIIKIDPIDAYNAWIDSIRT